MVSAVNMVAVRLKIIPPTSEKIGIIPNLPILISFIIRLVKIVIRAKMLSETIINFPIIRYLPFSSKNQTIKK
jgi:hypothetical protein